MNLEPRLQLCLVINCINLAVVVIAVLLFGEDDNYWRFGWNDSLKLICVPINSGHRYLGACLLIAFVNVSDVIIKEIGMPILNFTIYNPEQTHVTGFTKNRLQLYANAMYASSNLRFMFTMLVTVSQVDIALFSFFVSEIPALFTIRLLLNEKKFANEANDYQEI